MKLRRLAFLAAALVVAAGGAEVGARIYDRLRGHPFDPEASRAAVRRLCDALALESSALPGNAAADHGSSEKDARGTSEKHAGLEGEPKLLQPYTGWEPSSVQIRIAGDVERARAEKHEAFELCVLGGSTASALAGALANDAFLRGRNVRVHDYSVAGYKEPQMSKLLAWMFALGLRPDAVVEIDGGDEVLLAEANAAAGTHPGYPSVASWSDAAGGMRSDWGMVERLHEARAARDRTRAFGEWLLDSGLWRSCVSNHLAALRLSALEDARVEARRKLEDYVRTRPEDVELRGPAFARETSAVDEEIVSTWEAASRHLSAMCAARGIPFFLVLAPSGSNAASSDAALAVTSLRTAGETVTGPSSRFLDLSEIEPSRVVPAIAKALFAETER